MTGRLDGNVTIVTGGAIGGRFARESAEVVLAQRTVEEGSKLARAIAVDGGEAAVISPDVTSPACVEAMLQQTVATYANVDILVSGPGVGVLEDFVDLSMDNCTPSWR